MSLPLVAAATLSALASVVHPLAGELLILRHLPAAQQPSTPFGDGDITRRILRGVWHFVTIDFVLSAAMLTALSVRPWTEGSADVARFISAHFVAYAVLIWVCAGRRLAHVLTHVPQWILLLTIAVLAWWPTL